MLSRYNELVKAETLSNDSYQLKVVEELDKLCGELKDYKIKEVPTIESASILSKFSFFGKKEPEVVVEAPKGLYIYGAVGKKTFKAFYIILLSLGGGKTMLMDMFYERASIEKKSRVHFHEFMRNFHSRK